MFQRLFKIEEEAMCKGNRKNQKHFTSQIKSAFQTIIVSSEIQTRCDVRGIMIRDSVLYSIGHRSLIITSIK